MITRQRSKQRKQNEGRLINGVPEAVLVVILDFAIDTKPDWVQLQLVSKTIKLCARRTAAIGRWTFHIHGSLPVEALNSVAAEQVRKVQVHPWWTPDNIVDADIMLTAGRLLDWIASFKQLTHLTTSCIVMADSAANFLPTMKHLTYLDISRSPVTDTLAVALAPGKLTSLNMAGCTGVSDGMLEMMAGNPKNRLTNLNLSDNNTFTDQGVSHLKKLTALRTLNLAACAQLTFQDVVLPSSLQEVNLQSTSLTDRGMQSLRGLNQLRLLTLDRCRDITCKGLVVLGLLNALQKLSMSDCSGILPFPGSCLPPSLQMLNLCHTAVVKIGEGLPPSAFALDTLNLSHGVGIGPYLALLAADQPSLRSLDLSFNLLRDADMQSLKGMLALQTLDLSSCDELTSAGLNVIAEMVALCTLRLCDCDIDDDCMSTVCKLVNLQSLAVARCSSITDVGVAMLAPLTNLRALDVSDCLSVTRSGLQSLAPTMAVKFGLTLRGWGEPIWNIVGALPAEPAVTDLHAQPAGAVV